MDSDAPPSPPRLKLSSKLTLGLSAAIFGLSANLNYWTPLVLQTFILNSDCAQNDSAGCCRYCLGLSPMEYGSGIGVPAFLSSVVVLFSGAVVDILGLGTAGIILSAVMVFGSTIFAITPYITHYHNILFSFFAISRFCFACSYMWAIMMAQYTGIRYFVRKWQPLIIGLLHGAGSVGSILASLIGVRVAEYFGIHTVLFGVLILNLLHVLTAICLIVSFRFSSDIVTFEKDMRLQTDREVQPPPLRFIAQSVKAFHIEYWLIAFVISLTSASTSTYIANMQLIQTSLFSISVVTIGRNLSFTWIIEMLSAPFFGFFLTLVPVHLSIGFAALLLEVISFVVILFPEGSPLVSSLLSDVPHSILIVSLSPFLDITVPKNALGLATTMIHASDVMFSGILCLSTEAFLDIKDKQAAALNAIYFLLGIVGLQVAFLLIFSVRLKCECSPKERGEGQKLLEND